MLRRKILRKIQIQIQRKIQIQMQILRQIQIQIYKYTKMNIDACVSKRGSAFFWYSSFQQKSSKDYIVSANMEYYVDLGDEKQLNIFKCLEIV